MKKKVIQLMAICCLLFVGMLGVDLASESEKDLLTKEVFAKAKAQIYQACPGNFLAMSAETTETMLCAVSDPLPRLIEIAMSDCEYQLQTCCPPPPISSPTCQGLAGA